MKVADIMTNPAIVVSSYTTIEDTSKIMSRHNIGSVPVVDDKDNVVGIVTDRDIVIRTVARGLDPKTHKVHEIMTGNVKSVTPDASVDDAADIMASEKIRRLPVVEDNKVVGFVALGDVAVVSDFAYETAQALSEISEGCHQKFPKNKY